MRPGARSNNRVGLAAGQRSSTRPKTFELPTSVVDAAVALVQRGGQVVSLMDHDGWGNAEAHNAFFTAAGSTLRLNVVGASGTLPLVVHPFAGLTEGVASLSAFYSGNVTGGQGWAMSRWTVPPGP